MFSYDGFRYFVIFMDAHTKFIWFYPLVAKSDVFAIFHQFQALVERQFSLKIKSVQTDWGGEYRKLNTYFKTIGIQHRVICPHTHEQNGMVERRHRHIVETGLTLLGQCKAPLKYWSYDFESSVYLINRMPTAVLNHKTPFECLLKSTPDYAFLRTFGCLCFPFLRPYNAHKLDFRSSPCVFLGYSNSHLGYRCLDLSSNRIYLARHVRFHETVFPLDKTEQIVDSPIQPPAATLQPIPSSCPNTHPAPPAPLAHNTTLWAALPLPAYHCHDHSSGTGSDLPFSLAGSSAVFPVVPTSSKQSVEVTHVGSPVSSPVRLLRSEQIVTISPAVSPSRLGPVLSSSSPGSSSISSPGINLCVDLSQFSLQQATTSESATPPPAARTHSMVLRPRVSKTANFSVSPASRVVSLPQQEPLSFKDANWYLIWHNAMIEEIKALHGNHTWSLVPLHPSMNVVGSRWVYKIKRHADGRIDRYKARLVARGFMQ
jgi:histone deacetylase 1/2